MSIAWVYAPPSNGMYGAISTRDFALVHLYFMDRILAGSLFLSEDDKSSDVQKI